MECTEDKDLWLPYKGRGKNTGSQAYSGLAGQYTTTNTVRFEYRNAFGRFVINLQSIDT